jgi:hypothetical protein
MKFFLKLFIGLFSSLLIVIGSIYIVRLTLGLSPYVPLSYISAYFDKYTTDYWLKMVMNPINDAQSAIDSFINTSYDFWSGVANFFVMMYQCIAIPFKLIYSVFITLLDVLGIFPYIISYQGESVSVLL